MSKFIGGHWWERYFCVLPKRCALTDDIIWLEYAYRGKRPTAQGYTWHSALEHYKWADEIKRKTAEKFKIYY